MTIPVAIYLFNKTDDGVASLAEGLYTALLILLAYAMLQTLAHVSHVRIILTSFARAGHAQFTIAIKIIVCCSILNILQSRYAHRNHRGSLLHKNQPFV